MPGNTPDSYETALESYRAAASVLVYFHSDKLQPLDEKAKDDSVVMDLLDDCYQILDGPEDETIRWSLTNSVRRQSLRNLGSREVIKEALGANSERPETTLQMIFEAIIFKEPIEQTDDTSTLLAQIQVTEWLEGVVDGLPDRDKLIQAYEFQQLIEPFREITGPHFRGRDKHLTSMEAFVSTRNSARSVHKNPPLMVFGPGGVGKSTLVAKFILETLGTSSDGDFSFIYLDFERDSLWPDHTITLYAEIVRQLVIQFPFVKQSSANLRNKWLNHLLAIQRVEQRNDSVEILAEESFQTQGELIFDFGEFAKTIPDSRQRNLLFVLDSFEWVQRSRDFVNNTVDFLNELHTFFPYIRIVISGRVEISGLKVEPMLVGNLDEKSTARVLESRGILNQELQNLIFKRTDGDPLSLRLIADILNQGNHDLAVLDHFPDEIDEFSLDHSQNQTWLYVRYLDRIPNIEVKKLAHPGLVLRRVTPELIQHVLAEPCQVNVPDQETARALFNELAREVSLVVRESTWRIRHRPDVRSRMLRGLRQNAGKRYIEIHRNAVHYYAQQDPDPIGRAEEIYHHFFIGSSRELIDSLWEEDGLKGLEAQLVDAVDEVPIEWKAYLASRVGDTDTSTEIEWDEVAQQDWERFTTVRTSDLLASNRYREALGVLNERDNYLPGSNLFLLKATILERLKQYPSAYTCANDGISSALIANDFQLQWEMTLIALRSSEELGRWNDAWRFLSEAESIEYDKTSQELELLNDLELDMHRLRLCRLDPIACTQDRASLKENVRSRISENPEILRNTNLTLALLIDLSVELEEDSADLLWEIASRQKHLLNQEPFRRNLDSVVQSIVEADPDIEIDSAARFFSDGDVVDAALAILTQFAGKELPTNVYRPLIAIVQSLPTFSSNSETLNQQLINQLVVVLEAYFDDRASLIEYLLDNFPQIEANIKSESTFSSILEGTAANFEREGLTEDLIKSLRLRQDSEALDQLALTIQQIEDGKIKQGSPISGEDIRHIQGEDSIQGDIFEGDSIRVGDITEANAVAIGTNSRVTMNIFKNVTDILPHQVPESLRMVESPFEPPSMLDPEELFNWMAVMRAATRTVARFDTINGFLSAFLIAPDLIMSLKLKDGDNALNQSKLLFQHFLGRSVSQFENPTIYHLDKAPLVWVNNRIRCAVFEVEGLPGTDKIPFTEDAQRGWLRLARQKPEVGERVYCIHYPGGEGVKLSSAIVTEDKKRKLNLTLIENASMDHRGSLGAPWFNSRWEVFGLHRGIKRRTRNDVDNGTNLSIGWLDRLWRNREFASRISEHLPPGENPLNL